MLEPQFVGQMTSGSHALFFCLHSQRITNNIILQLGTCRNLIFFTMASLQEEVRDVCKLADAVLDDPTTPISITAKDLGLACLWGGGLYELLYKLWKKAYIEREEKERMLREVIRKQQALIRRINKELEENRRLHIQNQNKIKHLEEMLRMLENTENKIKAA